MTYLLAAIILEALATLGTILLTAAAVRAVVRGTSE